MDDDAVTLTAPLRAGEASHDAGDLDAEILAVLGECGSSNRVFAAVWGAVGLAWAADAIELSVIGFLRPCVGATFDLTTSQKATITSIVFVGEAGGAALFGVVADRVGRKPVSVCVVATVFCCAAASALAPTYGTFLALQCGVGVGVGGLAVPFDLCLEFVGEDRRGIALVGLNVWWAVGALYGSGAAWLVLGNGADAWRALVVVCAAPSLLAVLAVARLPESPRLCVPFFARASGSERVHATNCGEARAEANVPPWCQDT